MGGREESIGGAAARAVERSRRRYGAAIAGSNFVGALTVALFLAFALPNPRGLHHVDRLKLINLGVFIATAVVGWPAGWLWSKRLWQSRMAPLIEGREPTEREQRLILRFPLSQQRLSAVLWIVASALFSGVNAPASWQLAGNVGTGIALGGLITCALGYLLAERLLRPVTAALLAGRGPVSPQLPGVRVRALLTWTLGTGVVLTGLAMIGLTGLYEPVYDRIRLAVLMLVLSVVGLVIGFVSTDALARALADPITAIRRGLARVQAGDLDVAVTVDDGSEIGLLQAGFNNMVEGLREREQLRDLFGRQVGEEVARLTELAKREPGGVVCSAAALRQAGGTEAGRWQLGEELRLRGRDASTVVATPA